MTIPEMRYYISQHPRYKGTEAWKKRCAMMPERQVIAIYNKFKNLDYKALEAEMAEGAFVMPKEEYHQINMFEYMMSRKWGSMNIRYNTDIENVKKQAMLDLLKDMPLQTLQVAYIYAKNYTEYGEDITKTWVTVTQNTSALEKAYRKGYYDGMKRQAESEE